MSGADSLDFESLFEGGNVKAEEISNMWMEWTSARQQAEERWKETQQYVYATSTRETSNNTVGGVEEDDDSGWSHSTHVPKITQIFDNLSANYMSALIPHEDWFKFVGNDGEAVLKSTRKTVEAYLQTKHRLNGLRTVVQRLIDDWILYGNCFAMVSYEDETNNEKDFSQADRLNYSGPRVHRISPFDIVFNPLATSFENSPKIVRSLKTMGEIARDIEDKPELGYEREILGRMSEVRSRIRRANVEDFDKTVQMQFDGFGTASQYFNSGFVEVLEFYGDTYDIETNQFLKNYVITVVDRTWAIRAQPLDTWSGRPNIFHSGWRFRQDNLWAMSPLANLVGMQYLVNHLENARADAFDQMLEPTRVLVGDVEEDGVEAGVPGGTYSIPSGEGSVSNLLPDTTVLTADIQIDRKMEQMEEFAGAPKQTLGIKAPGEQTATEANILNTASSRIFQNKLTNFEETFLDQILNAELEVARRNLNATDVVKVVGDDGIVEFIDISKNDLLANGKLVPIGARHFSRQLQLTNNLSLLSQALQVDPMMQQHFPSLKMAELYQELLDFDKMELVLPYGRVAEQAELARTSDAASQQVESESQVDLETTEEPQSDAEEGEGEAV